MVLGRFEELNDTPEFQSSRAHALALLQRRAMWWEPGATDPTNRPARRETSPVVFRIAIEHLSGRRRVPTSDETAAASGASMSERRAAG